MGKRGPQPIYPPSERFSFRIWVENLARMPEKKRAEWINQAIKEKAERDEENRIDLGN